MSFFSPRLFSGLRLPLSSLSAKRSAKAEAKAVLLEETHRERTDTDSVLRVLSPVAAPPDLQLRLRLALSHERVRAERRWTGRIAFRWNNLLENIFRPMAVQGAVAVTAVVLLIGAAASLGAVTPQQVVEANDIPLDGFSAPRYLYSSSGSLHPLAAKSEAPLMVEAKIDTRGRVYHYRVLSGTIDAETDAALRERMLFSVFQPAFVFGQAVHGSLVLTFADVEVHG